MYAAFSLNVHGHFVIVALVRALNCALAFFLSFTLYLLLSLAVSVYLFLSVSLSLSLSIFVSIFFSHSLSISIYIFYSFSLSIPTNPALYQMLGRHCVEYTDTLQPLLLHNILTGMIQIGCWMVIRMFSYSEIIDQIGQVCLPYTLSTESY